MNNQVKIICPMTFRNRFVSSRTYKRVCESRTHVINPGAASYLD